MSRNGRELKNINQPQVAYQGFIGSPQGFVLKWATCPIAIAKCFKGTRHETGIYARLAVEPLSVVY
jgi:hypothetical protein